MSKKILTLANIQEAHEAMRGVLINTPTVWSPFFSTLVRGEVYLKLENLQATGSFKSRGSFWKMRTLLQEKKNLRGVVAVSAGNHAQGVAFQAKTLNIPAWIVMPENTPTTKIQRTQDLGARVILSGEDFKEAAEFGAKFAEERGLTLVHPYDDPQVMAGQGTIGIELLEAVPDLEILLIPVGGGGLIAGCAVAAKAINPKIKIIGVQAKTFPYMAEIFGHSRPRNEASQSLAEGIAVKNPGKLTREVMQDLVDEMMLVSEEKIERAIFLLAMQQKQVSEGAGVAGIAALLTNQDMFDGKRVGTIITGGNVDARILASVLMRGLAQEGKLVRFRVEMKDLPLALARACLCIGKSGGNILEVIHQRIMNAASPKNAEVELLVETRNAHHAQEILEGLLDEGFSTRISHE